MARTLDDLAGAQPTGPSGVKLWFAGARPRTLAVAVIPVLVGTACAVGQVSGGLIWWCAFAALIVGVGVQVGTNYGNDYSDGIRGTDEQRVGPVRLVASRLATPPQVLAAAIIAFGVACVAGLALAAATSWWLILVGVACVAAGWLYTGGPKPYGYYGFGEIFVFVFFGLVAVVGSEFVQQETVSGLAVLASLPVGLYAVAVLVANNLRDIPTDIVAGKRTLATRIGDGATRRLYAATMLLPFVLLVPIAVSRPWALIGLLAVPLAVPPSRRVLAGESGRDLVRSLLDTVRTLTAFGLLLALGLALSG
jgi:1,4-dihydroxy-2-naphthoate octaprenyltransferase